MTTETRDKYWRKWKEYVGPLGVNPYLQKETTRHTKKYKHFQVLQHKSELADMAEEARFQLHR